MLDFETATSIEECRNLCQAQTDCEYFTWFENDNDCLLFSDCDFNATMCDNCYTGSVNCSVYTCFEAGTCQNGLYLAHDHLRDADECLNYCQSEPGCKWFSFDPSDGNICVLTETCPNVTTSCAGSGCVRGQVECGLEAVIDVNFTIMVATGSNNGYLDHVEIINTTTLTSCPNLPAPYPVTVQLPVALKHDSKPVICGGDPLTFDCYSYSNNIWSIEPYQLVPARYGASALEIRPDEWLIMGGFDGTNYLNNTKVLKYGLLLNGPELPEASYGGSSVMLNETHLMVMIGRKSAPDFSTSNYLLDINAERWTQVADRELEPTQYHASGTFFNSTAGEIQVANIL